VPHLRSLKRHHFVRKRDQVEGKRRKEAEAPGALDMEWGSLLLVGSFLVDMFILFVVRCTVVRRGKCKY